MKFTESLMTAVEKKLNLIPQDRIHFAFILDRNWYDSVPTLRGATVNDLERLGIPHKVCVEITKQVQVMAKHYRPKVATKALGVKILPSQGAQSLTFGDPDSDPKNPKRVKPDRSGLVEVNPSSKHPAAIRTQTKEYLKAFLALPIEKSEKKESLYFLRDMLARVRDFPAQIQSRSIDTQKPEAFEKVFKFTELSKLFPLVGFQDQSETRLYLPEKAFFRPVFIGCVEIIENFLGSLNGNEIEIDSQSESEVIDVNDDSGSIIIEEQPTDPELMARVDSFYKKIFPNFRHKIQPEVHLISAREGKQFTMEGGAHHIASPLLEEGFAAIRREFNEFYSELTKHENSMKGKLGVAARQLLYLLNGEYIDIKLKMDMNQHLEIKLSKFEAVSRIFGLVRQYVIKSDQKFSLFEPLIVRRLEVDDGNYSALLGDVWKEKAVTLSLVIAAKEYPAERTFDVSSKVEVISS